MIQPTTAETAIQRPLNCAAIVLAGGKSTRFGSDKALLQLGGQPLITRTVARLSELAHELVIVSNNPGPYVALGLPARIVPDVVPGEGSLMGVYSGLRAVRSERAVCVACDMPFLSLSLLRFMLHQAPGYDVVVPYLGRFYEPLFAVYGRGCLKPMKRALDKGSRQIISFYDNVRVRRITAAEVDAHDPLRISFVNVNTPQDWDRVQRLLAEHG